MKILVIFSLISGCASSKPLEYESKAPAAPISSNDFNELWDASLASVRDYHFEVDRQDRRAGVITTRPMISSQFFEPWRNELKTADAVAESSLSTVRRTVTINVIEQEGRYTATPTVRVERLSRRGRRMTSSAQFTSAFRANAERGSMESDRGIDLPSQYWYEIGVDSALAKSVSDQISHRLK